MSDNASCTVRPILLDAVTGPRPGPAISVPCLQPSTGAEQDLVEPRPSSVAAAAKGATREQNRATLERAFTAMGRRDSATMVAAYAPDATFNDPVFGSLSGSSVRTMWTKRLAQYPDFAATIDALDATDKGGTVRWTARYTSPTTQQQVVVETTSEITMRDGRIVRQNDTFDFALWAKQAEGGVIGGMAQSRLTRALAQRLVQAEARRRIGVE